MGNRAELLADLRQRAGITALQERECWQNSHLSAGVPKGVVAELCGNAKTEWLLHLFKENPDALILWCEETGKINPTAIHQRGVSLERIKFVNSFQNLQQPLRIALESKFYPFIVCPQVFDETTVFQRFHLLAEKSHSTLFLLSDGNFSQAWPISLQLDINFTEENEFAIDVVRQKHGARG